MTKILSVIERAYHGTLEEQDDTALWITHAVKNAGGEMATLLRGNAVNYAVQGQDATGLQFGGVALSVPPKIDQDIVKMMEKGIAVFIVQEDLQQRGITTADLISGVTLVGRGDLARLFDEHDQIWHW